MQLTFLLGLHHTVITGKFSHQLHRTNCHEVTMRSLAVKKSLKPFEMSYDMRQLAIHGISAPPMRHSSSARLQVMAPEQQAQPRITIQNQAHRRART